ncbi:hypothetical protein GW17_00013448 [Ensete ventricosum]|nr:hypothetical protein GW17_00013448 [Ensete ventricosum]
MRRPRQRAVAVHARFFSRTWRQNVSPRGEKDRGDQCEKLRADAGVLPGLRAELEALRRRHSAALELMGEHDEEVLILTHAI